ncbi:signal peptide peptidase-like 2B-like [Sarcoptes scabiei]|nr:signal peptide peptidase-like 2B-like [Sarcoptes scabiei]
MANSNYHQSSSDKGDDGNHSQHNHHQIFPKANSIMSLRNRSFKVGATAGIDTNTNPNTHDGNPSIIANDNSLLSLRKHKHQADHLHHHPYDSKNLDDSENSLRRRSRRHQTPSTSAVCCRNCDTTSNKSIKNLPKKEDEDKENHIHTPTTKRSLQSFFPLRTIGEVCDLFRYQIGPLSDAKKCSPNKQLNHDISPTNNHHRKKNSEPDLALLSIVIGLIEISITRGLYEDENDGIHSEEKCERSNSNLTNVPLTQKNNHSSNKSTNSITNCHSAGHYSPAEATPAPIVAMSNVIHSSMDIPIPTVYYENIETLLKKFQTHIKESIDLSKFPKKTSRELIKKISEVIWSNLHRSHYKDRAHLQTLYSYVTDNKLDCYGVAYAVLAACQILGLDDVNLVMSEDHTWISFGEGETCEVTWHGKSAGEDRCGQPIPTDINCWLYLNGNTMTCDRHLIVATLVSAMNLSINALQDSKELAILQLHLLWILYDHGYLERYPMALGNLGDLEDICVDVVSRKHPIELFDEAIKSARKYYNDYHVYPYTYIGGYFFRNCRFKDALKSWADAAQIVSKYNYTRDDEEIYKEFQEISNDVIPHIMKNSTSCDSIIRDPECFAYLIRFYDGLCAWEEESPTPVLHIGWTRPIVSMISKFPFSTRFQVALKVGFNPETIYHDKEDDHEIENHNHFNQRERRSRRAASISFSTINNKNHQNGQPLEKSCENIAKDENESIPKPKNEIKYFKDHPIDHNNDEDKTLKRPAVFDHSKYDPDGLGFKNERKNTIVIERNPNDSSKQSVTIYLASKKFIGIKNLLVADKLNTSAIQLQLTAQSQVNMNKRSRLSSNSSMANKNLCTASTNSNNHHNQNHSSSSASNSNNHNSIH